MATMHGVSGMGVMGFGGLAGWRLHRMARVRAGRHDITSLLGMTGVRVVLHGFGGSRCMTRVWIRRLRYRLGRMVHVRGVVGRHARLIGGAGRRIMACMWVVRHDSTGLLGMSGMRIVLRSLGGGGGCMARVRIHRLRHRMGRRVHVHGVVGRHVRLLGDAGRCVVACMHVVRHDSTGLLGMSGVRIVLRGLGGGSRCMARVWIRRLRHRMGRRVHVHGVVGRHVRLIRGAGRCIVACMRVVRHDSTGLLGMAGVRVALRGLGYGGRCMARMWIRFRGGPMAVMARMRVLRGGVAGGRGQGDEQQGSGRRLHASILTSRIMPASMWYSRWQWKAQRPSASARTR
ncbi:hypothetical protein [Stenotrophomonas sp. MYb238]|uniref:hypothetical protein n=1 Tax=Stenotrophomonas sp. MYb238 TaxID=2040281 RepID=UPI001D174939|nr:hypothetical protein [Stenotrophomonas sp. MYb238]